MAVVDASVLVAALVDVAHADLGALSIELVPFTPFADRVWDLRANVTSRCPLLTPDVR